MNKYFIFTLFILLFSCFEDDGEKTYNHFAKNDQIFKLYDYNEPLILDVYYTNWDLDLRKQNLILKK